MKKLMLIIPICLHLAFRSAAGPSEPGLQYNHLYAQIPSPVLQLAAKHEIRKPESLDFQNLAHAVIPTPGSPATARWNTTYYRDPLKAGIGLTISGAILTMLGAALIISGTQQHSYTDVTGYHKRDPMPYYAVGGLAAAGGLAMLIPGVVLISRHRR